MSEAVLDSESADKLEADNNAEKIVIEKQIIVEDEHQSAKARAITGLKRFHEFINPSNTVTDTGMSRIICLEFLRGISVFTMLAGHEADTLFDESDILKPTFNGILSTIVGAPFGLFSGYRTFFILISGTAHAYSFFMKCFDKPPARLITEQLIEFIGSIILLPLFFMWHIFNSVGYKLQWGKLDLKFPLWKSAESYCHAVMYFGLTTPISILILLLMYCILVVPFQARLQKRTILLIFYGLCMTVVVIWPFVFMDFSDILARRFAPLVGKNYRDFENPECPGNEGITVNTFGDKLTEIGMHFLAGEHMEFNMQYTFCVAGFALGAALAMMVHEKQRIIGLEDDSDKAKQYKRLKLAIHLLISMPVILFGVLTAPVIIEGRAELKSGRRKNFFTFSDFMSNFFPNNCFFPEYAVPELATQFLLFYLAFLIFECCGEKKGRVRAERILYLRRFSTYSLSSFVFGYYISPWIRAVLNLSKETAGEKLQWWEFLLYLLGYFAVVLLAHLWLDAIQGRLTPDWFLKVVGHLFSHGKGAWKPLPQGHLAIREMTVCAKELE